MPPANATCLTLAQIHTGGIGRRGKLLVMRSEIVARETISVVRARPGFGQFAQRDGIEHHDGAVFEADPIACRPCICLARLD